MKRILLILLTATVTLNAAPLEIVKNHRSDYVIVTKADALSAIKVAAEELQKIVFEATGAKLPIVHNADGKKTIILATDTTLPPEGFKLRTDNGNLYISGHDSPGNARTYPWIGKIMTGTWYGVNRIVERYLDFRHFFPGKIGIYLPKRADLTIPELNESDAPVMIYRRFPPWWYLRNRKYFGEMNLWRRHNSLGISIAWYNNHMWRYILPPEKYLAKHPDWFALLDGRRTKQVFEEAEGIKICTSNMEALKEYARIAVEQSKKEKREFFSVTPNDGIRFCECDECRKDDLINPDGSRNMSNRMFLYANRLAEMICKELPDLKIAMLAYSFYTKVPTKVAKLHPNMRIMYVRNSADSLYYNPDFREPFKRDLIAWNRFAPKPVLFYNTPMTMIEMPFFNPENLKKLYADLGETGVVGFSLEHTASFWAQGMNHYMNIRMLWNPKANFDAIYADALEKCYGKAAAPAMRAYFADVAEGNKIYTLYLCKYKPEYREQLPKALELSWNKLYEKHYAVLEQAQKKTADAGQKARLEMVLSNLRYVRLTLDLFRTANAALKSGNPAQSARAIQLAEQRKKMLAEMNKRYPDVQPWGIERREKWYRLPFDPVMLKRQLFQRKTPYVTVFGSGTPQKAVIASDMTDGTPVAAKGVCTLSGDDKALTVKIRMEESLMEKISDHRVKPNSTVWEENCVDLFFDPGCTGKGMIHLIANSKGTLFAARDGVKPWNHHITVTASKEKAAWLLTLTIPWSDFGGKPVPGTIWGFNAGRVRKTVAPAVYSCWSPTFGNFNRREFFGRLIF